MQYLTHVNIFAQVYGSCSYGGSSYSQNSCQTTAVTSPSNNTGSILTNTGFDIGLVVTIACALIFAALVVRFWRRPKRQQPGGKV